VKSQLQYNSDGIYYQEYLASMFKDRASDLETEKTEAVERSRQKRVARACDSCYQKKVCSPEDEAPNLNLAWVNCVEAVFIGP
jgi:hypothetical protein